MADDQLDPETQIEEVYEYITGLDIMSTKVSREVSIEFLDGLIGNLRDFSNAMHQEQEQANIDAADEDVYGDPLEVEDFE